MCWNDSSLENVEREFPLIVLLEVLVLAPYIATSVYSDFLRHSKLLTKTGQILSIRLLSRQ